MKSQKLKEIEKVLRKIDNDKIYYLKAKNLKEVENKLDFLHSTDKFIVITPEQLDFLRHSSGYTESPRFTTFSYNKEGEELGLYCVGKLLGFKLWMKKK